MDVVVEGFQRRDVEDANTRALSRLAVEAIEDCEERCERLARPGRRHEEDVLAPRDRWPGELLRARRRGVGAREPGGDDRAEWNGHWKTNCSRDRVPSPRPRA